MTNDGNTGDAENIRLPVRLGSGRVQGRRRMRDARRLHHRPVADTMSNPRYRNGHRRREVQAYYRARRSDCYICGRPIDYALRPPDPWSFVVDETVAIANGGRVCKANSGPAHRWCNAVKGTHTLEWARAEVRRRLNGGEPSSMPKPRDFEAADW